MPDRSSPILRISGLTKHFQDHRNWWLALLNGSAPDSSVVAAVQDVSLEIPRGQTFGLLGESGCGKTTLARTLLRLTEPTAGEAWLDGRPIFEMGADEVRSTLRSRVRMIFQHPEAVLNPAYTVREVLEQALRLHTELDESGRDQRARDLLEQVELPTHYLGKYPTQLSGGQKRRIGICRALATRPDVIVADEPLSGLDVALQEQIVELFETIQREHALTMLLISHDVGLILRLCDAVGIMLDGELVEVLQEGQMTPEACDHPYAESLLQAHFEVQSST